MHALWLSLYSILLKFVYKFVIIKKGEFFGLLGFDDDFTLNKQMCFRDCFVGQYQSLLKIVDEAYDLVHGSCTSQKCPRS